MIVHFGAKIGVGIAIAKLDVSTLCGPIVGTLDSGGNFDLWIGSYIYPVSDDNIIVKIVISSFIMKLEMYNLLEVKVQIFLLLK